VVAAFDGGAVTLDAEALLLRTLKMSLSLCAPVRTRLPISLWY